MSSSPLFTGGELGNSSSDHDDGGAFHISRTHSRVAHASLIVAHAPVPTGIILSVHGGCGGGGGGYLTVYCFFIVHASARAYRAQNLSTCAHERREGGGGGEEEEREGA